MPRDQADRDPAVRQDTTAARNAYTAARDLTVTNNYYPAGAGRPPEPGPQAAGGPVVAGDVPQQPPGFQPRADLLAELDARPGRGCWWSTR